MFNTDSRADQWQDDGNSARGKPYVHWAAGPSQEISWTDKQEADECPTIDTSVALRVSRHRRADDRQSNGRQGFSFSVAWARVGLILLLCVAIAFGFWARYEVDHAVAQFSKSTTWIRPHLPEQNSLAQTDAIEFEQTPEFVPVTFTRSSTAAREELLATIPPNRGLTVDPSILEEFHRQEHVSHLRLEFDTSEIVKVVSRRWNMIKADRRKEAVRNRRKDRHADEESTTRIVSVDSEPSVFEYAKQDKSPGLLDYVKQFVRNNVNKRSSPTAEKR